MKKPTRIIFMTIACGIAAFFLTMSFRQSNPAFFNPGVSPASAQAPGGHAGHGGAPPPPPEPQAGAEVDEFGEDTTTIEIPLDKQQLIGVKTVAVSVRPLRRAIRTIGRIEYDERRLATINTKIEGWIEKLHVNFTGDYVEKGGPVAEIYSPELYATQQEFLHLLEWAGKTPAAPAPRALYYGKDSSLAEMLSRDAESMVEAARQRLKLWDISEAQIQKIEKTGAPVRTLTIYSPVSGHVIQRAALQGMRVMVGEKLLDIVDLSTVWVVADIYEHDLPFVKTGQTATISPSYFPGKKFESIIDFVYPVLAGETRTAKARFTIANPGGELKPQMYTDVEIFIDLGSRLAVPEAAVINTGTRRIIYVDKGDGYFEPREVTTGIRADGLIEVTAGVEAGDQVASEATFLIDSEARLKGVVQ
jgi:Cu(I)/Ag(I) efflux system membrane fusion protein